MKKIKKLLSIMLSLAMIFMVIPIAHTHANGNMSMNADDNAVLVDEEKIYCKATIDDDFEDDKVIVVLKHSKSMEFKDFSIADFQNINAKSIRDLTYETGKMVKAKVQNIDIVLEDGNVVKSDNDTNIDKYNQIIAIELEEKGKKQVIEAIKQLEKIDSVKYAGPNYIYYMSSSSLPTLTPNEYNDSIPNSIFVPHNFIQLPKAWYYETGSDTNGVTVGIIDSGIMGTHPDLVDNLSNSLPESFLPSPDNPLIDVSGHGTHIAGIIGAQGNNYNVTGEFVGVCWDIQLVSLKTAEWDPDQNAYASDTEKITEAVIYADNNNIDILNFSGGGGFTDEDYALEDAIDAYGGIFVCAAGNENQDNDDVNYSPGNLSCSNIIVVGASNTGTNVNRCPSSNHGITNVDIFAPGENIYSCWLGNSYNELSGTSMATPFVTGVAALLLSYDPSLYAYEIKSLIMDNVDEHINLSNYCVSGGTVNAYKALNALMNPVLPPPPPAHTCSLRYEVLDSSTHRVYCIGCDVEGTENHVYKLTNGNNKCTRCNYIQHDCSYTYTSLGSSSHRATCTICSKTFTESHDVVAINQWIWECSKCDYQSAGQIWGFRNE